MKDIEPKRPENLGPIAGEILDRLKNVPEAGNFVIGGGVALIATSRRVLRTTSMHGGRKTPTPVNEPRRSIEFARSREKWLGQRISTSSSGRYR